VVTCEIEH